VILFMRSSKSSQFFSVLDFYSSLSLFIVIEDRHKTKSILIWLPLSLTPTAGLFLVLISLSSISMLSLVFF
jgi:hypothetical protein